MVELQHVLVSICLFFPALASAFRETFCNEESLVQTRTKPQGTIFLPSTTVNYPYKRCQVEISSPMDSETQLTLVNVRRRRRPTELCYKNAIKIVAEVQNKYSGHTFCRSVGSVVNLTMNATIIKMDYTASFRNEIKINRTKNAVSVHYKRIDLRKACRHEVIGQNGHFETVGYPHHPFQGECEWVISRDERVEENTTIDFTILNPYHLNCENNFIEVLQGENIAARLLVKICKPNQSTKISSSASKLWVRIKSSSTNGTGFKAVYRTQILRKTPTCKVTLASKQSNFESKTGSSCNIWNLTASHGHIVALSFSQFNLVSVDSTLCLGNVIEIWDGKTKTVYCNLKRPPSIVKSKGRNMVVKYRSREYGSFRASFISILSSSFKTNCFVQEEELKFKCKNHQVITCAWQCDGAMQCSDNSDEASCSEMKARWHKLEVFVIVMGCICASTIIFCVGMVCFRRCLIPERSSSSSRRSRHMSTTDQSPLTPNADLPSPPPCYFSDRDEERPASVIHGTYFFGDEFSQSGIHNASLFGIPPPRYRSTESLHPSNNDTRSIWQRGLSSIPLVATEGTRIISLPEEDPPGYDSLSADKDEQIVTNPELPQNSNMPLEPEVCLTRSPESSSNEGYADGSHLSNETPSELQTRVPPASTLTECAAEVHNSHQDIGLTNIGAVLNV